MPHIPGGKMIEELIKRLESNKFASGGGAKRAQGLVLDIQPTGDSDLAQIDIP